MNVYGVTYYSGWGFSKQQINNFIAGPAFLAWWEMNNLEGWGGPNPDSWYEQQSLAKRYCNE